MEEATHFRCSSKVCRTGCSLISNVGIFDKSLGVGRHDAFHAWYTTDGTDRRDTPTADYYSRFVNRKPHGRYCARSSTNLVRKRIHS